MAEQYISNISKLMAFLNIELINLRPYSIFNSAHISQYQECLFEYYSDIIDDTLYDYQWRQSIIINQILPTIKKLQNEIMSVCLNISDSTSFVIQQGKKVMEICDDILTATYQTTVNYISASHNHGYDDQLLEICINILADN